MHALYAVVAEVSYYLSGFSKEINRDYLMNTLGISKLYINRDVDIIIKELLKAAGERQVYCNIEDDMVKGMFGMIVQGYLKKGYNRATVEMMAREFLGMRVEIIIDVLDKMLYTLMIKLDKNQYDLDKIIIGRKGGMVCFILH